MYAAAPSMDDDTTDDLAPPAPPPNLPAESEEDDDEDEDNDDVDEDETHDHIEEEEEEEDHGDEDDDDDEAAAAEEEDVEDDHDDEEEEDDDVDDHEHDEGEEEEDEEEEEEEEEEEDEEEEEEEGATADPEIAAGEDGGVATSTSSSSSLNLNIAAVPNLESLSHLREIGKEALCWQLSSAKPGNGVEQIRDASLDTYWQSDGTKQPHWIQVHFARRVAVSHVCLYLDYSLDESYTPKKVGVQHGMTNQDLQAAVHPSNTQIEFNEPVGWCIVPLSCPPDPLDECCGLQQDQDHINNGMNGDNHIYDGGGQYYQRNRQLVRTHLLRISIITMHQNGRDTHIRQVLLYGPRMMQESTYLPRIHHSSLAAAAAAAAEQQQQLDTTATTDENVVPPLRHGGSNNYKNPHGGGGGGGGDEDDDHDDDDSDLGNFMMQPFGTIR